MQHRTGTLENLSRQATEWAGSSWALLAAVGLLVVWGISRPLFDSTATWLLVVNTVTTICTFLMVFLIQRSQNKESRAMQLKLNELVAAHEGASNNLINIEGLSERQVRELHERFARLAKNLHEAHAHSDSHSIDEAEDDLQQADEVLSQAEAVHGATRKR